MGRVPPQLPFAVLAAACAGFLAAILLSNRDLLGSRDLLAMASTLFGIAGLTVAALTVEKALGGRTIGFALGVTGGAVLGILFWLAYFSGNPFDGYYVAIILWTGSFLAMAAVAFLANGGEGLAARWTGLRLAAVPGFAAAALWVWMDGFNAWFVGNLLALVGMGLLALMARGRSPSP